MNAAGRQTPLQRFEGEIRWYAKQCLKTGDHPLFNNVLYEKLDMFMTNYGNEELRISLWSLVQQWISEVIIENSCTNEYRPSAPITIVPPDNARIKYSEVERLKVAYIGIGNQLKSAKVGDELEFREPGITEVLRFWKSLGILREPEFTQLIKQLWKDFHEPILQPITESKDIVPGIDDFESFVAEPKRKVCLLCRKVYAGTKCLIQHVLESHSIFEYYCGQTTCTYHSSSKRYLHLHERGSHFICTICRNKFSSTHELKSHVAQEHPETIPETKPEKKKLLEESTSTCVPKKKRNDNSCTQKESSTPSPSPETDSEKENETVRKYTTCMDKEPSSSDRRSPMAPKSSNHLASSSTTQELETKITKLKAEKTKYKTTAFLQQKLIKRLCDKLRTCQGPTDVSYLYEWDEALECIEPKIVYTPVEVPVFEDLVPCPTLGLVGNENESLWTVDASIIEIEELLKLAPKLTDLH